MQTILSKTKCKIKLTRIEVHLQYNYVNATIIWKSSHKNLMIDKIFPYNSLSVELYSKLLNLIYLKILYSQKCHKYMHNNLMCDATVDRLIYTQCYFCSFTPTHYIPRPPFHHKPKYLQFWYYCSSPPTML